MDPILGSAIIGAGANLIGGLVSGSQNYKLGKRQLEWQQYAQQKTWEREDNAVQRRVADLKAAGMNRLLAAGSGASTSAPVHVDAPQAPDLSGIGNPMLQYAQTKMALNKQQADISQTEAQTRLLTGQLATVTKQNELLQRTLDWYKDHPDSAPNIPGMGTTNSIKAAGDFVSSIFGSDQYLLGRLAGRLGTWSGRVKAQHSHVTPESKKKYLEQFK